MNRQIGVEVSQFLVVTGPLPTGHATQRLRNGHFRQYNSLTRLNIIMAVKQEIVNVDTSNLVHSFLLEKSNRRSNNFPPKGRGLGHVTPKIFGIRLNISSKLLELETSNLANSFN